MTKKPPVKCPMCGQSFLREEVEGFVEYKRRFYHPDCYIEKQKQEFTQNKKSKKHVYSPTEQEIVNKIQAKAQIECGELYNPQLVGKQIKKYLQEGKTLERIYQTLLYWYDERHEDASKSKGGIGIVPYVYEEAIKFWDNKKKRNQQFHNLKPNNLTKRSKEFSQERRTCGKRYKVQQPQRVNYFNLD